MPDMTEQIQNLLSDPDGMERLRAMAESLFSSSASPESQKKEEEPQGGLDMTALISAAGSLSKRQDDDRVKLLRALRPHLSPERQGRVDKAIKMLRLLDIAPMLQKFGLFEL